MRLIRFRVRNFRSVIDSEWIDVERVTSLIGVNESGKTNLLLPLWKLNPAREGEIQPTSDYPKGYFGQVRDNPGSYDFIVAEFALPLKLVGEVASLTGVAPDILDVVRVGRDYENRTFATFPKYVAIRELASSDLAEQLEFARAELAAISPLRLESSLHPVLVSATTWVRKNPRKQEPFASSLSSSDFSLKRFSNLVVISKKRVGVQISTTSQP
ncbi:hypothetical protein [Bradyrhizobium liaoningense]|uniref:hypothetical protein n=1 Tax=Bradyrhizobium liaoningense TaxID=43992 RepID=UPI001BAAC9B0|nr:hypothetical protein [Bradyrhizobium liaoningense]MBR0903448.1 hypothetical protein [Bradyrhizobium liaoningense]